MKAFYTLTEISKLYGMSVRTVGRKIDVWNKENPDRPINPVQEGRSKQIGYQQVVNVFGPIPEPSLDNQEDDSPATFPTSSDLTTRPRAVEIDYGPIGGNRGLNPLNVKGLEGLKDLNNLTSQAIQYGRQYVLELDAKLEDLTDQLRTLESNNEVLEDTVRQVQIRQEMATVEARIKAENLQREVRKANRLQADLNPMDG